MTDFDWNAWLASLGDEHVPDPRLGVWEIEVLKPPGEAPRVTGWTSAPDALAAIRREASRRGAVVEAGALPGPACGGQVRAVACRTVAHVRRHPRHAAELVSQILLGEEALVLRVAGAWLQVQTADRYIGWVHEGYVRRTVPTDDAAFREHLFARRPPNGAWVVVARAALARESPEPAAPPVAVLVQGSVVTAAPESGALRITLPDGGRGWLPTVAAVPVVRLDEHFPASGSSILDHAAGFLGLAYLWGGTSEHGFDCSGLVQRVFALHGVHLPRDSDQQAKEGEPVEPDGDGTGIEDGDLAFFAEVPDDRITHVGILARGGRLLHASTTRGGVAWDGLYTGAGASDFGARLRSWLVAIRRVIPPPAAAARPAHSADHTALRRLGIRRAGPASE